MTPDGSSRVSEATSLTALTHDGAQAGTASASGALAQPRGAVRAVDSVRRALQILRCFSQAEPELSLSEIARKTGMTKTTADRLLATLELERFVYRQRDGRYALSWTLFSIVSGTASLRALSAHVMRVLENLASETGETAHLAVLDQGQVLYIAKVESTRSLRMPSAVGEHVPVHATGLGKALLSGLSEEEIAKIAYGAPLKAFTKHTITDPKTLIQAVTETAQNGFALDQSELEEGLQCIAAPVKGEGGDVCAGVSVAGPSSRVEHMKGEKIVAVMKAAQTISDDCGPEVQSLMDSRFVIES